jgi:hypothetical protein
MVPRHYWGCNGLDWIPAVPVAANALRAADKPNRFRE